MKTVTPKQLAANRANAARSTGPRTPEGKARSCRNARTHGLTAALYSILRIEDRDAIEQIRADTVAAYDPVNSEELLAVERIAIAKVALIRAARLEAGLFTLALNHALNDNNVTPFVSLDPSLAEEYETKRDQVRNYALADGFQRLALASNSFSLFLRYQAQSERQYRRAVEEFTRLRRLRDDFPIEPISDPQPESPEPLPPPPNEPISPIPEPHSGEPHPRSAIPEPRSGEPQPRGAQRRSRTAANPQPPTPCAILGLSPHFPSRGTNPLGFNRRLPALAGDRHPY